MKQRGFAIVISTADRSPARNYLVDTLNALMQSGVFSSAIPHRVIVVDTGKGVMQRSRAAIWFASHGIPVEIVTPERHGSSPDNAAEGLWAAASTVNAEWVLFLEDDIEACGSFLESVDAWLRDHATDDVPMYPFCAAYSKNAGRERSAKSWKYGLGSFYGTQAYAIRGKDAVSASVFLRKEARARNQTNGHDLLLRDWVLSEYPDCTHLLSPGMDFVQHVGKESSIHAGRFHSYPHFGGYGWRYENGEHTYYSPEELQRSKFSPNLARLLAKTLDRNLPVYDMGCGIGKYAAWLEQEGFVVLGIEGHPQARSVAVTPSIASWDLSKPLPRQILGMPGGSVVSIEVGEHIPAEHAETFVSNLVAMCKSTLLLTWAIRGQGGHRHINELDEQEIVPMVEARGFRLDREKTAEWRKTAGDDLRWFKRSIYCFDRI